MTKEEFCDLLEEYHCLCDEYSSICRKDDYADISEEHRYEVWKARDNLEIRLWDLVKDEVKSDD